MRLKRAVWAAKFGLALGGAALLISAWLAQSLGIDHNGGWGRGRILLAGAGLVLIGGFLGLQYAVGLRRLANRLAQSPVSAAGRRVAALLAAAGWRINRAWHALPPVRWLRAHPGAEPVVFGGLGLGLTLFIYLGYITCGTLTHWFPYTTYFDQLAQGFLGGQLSLLVQPPPELLALANPYDYHQRAGIAYLWDASLYEGRYYYYWGPVPALVAAGAKEVISLISGQPVIVEDQALVFFFCGGAAAALTLLLIRLRARFFSTAPAWTLTPLVMLPGLAVPVLWLINRPSVYETAIAGGQFFLLWGLYAGLRAVEPGPKTGGWLLLTGFAWGAAVNCRLNLAVAVIFFTILLGWVLLKQGSFTARGAVRLVWLALPLAAWAVGLGWYNAARFGSILETGHRYQLTGPALPANYTSVTSLAYLLPSLYSYLVRPLEILPREFPFVFAPFIKETMWPFFIRLPENYYYAEPVAGLLAAIPGLWLAGLPLLGGMRRAWQWLNERPADPPTANHPAWLGWAGWGGWFCLFAPLLIFISTSMRYLADAVPMAGLIAACGLWWGLAFFHNHPGWRRWLIAAAVILILVSIGLSLLANLTSGDQRIMTQNPGLYAALETIFK